MPELELVWQTSPTGSVCYHKTFCYIINMRQEDISQRNFVLTLFHRVGNFRFKAPEDAGRLKVYFSTRLGQNVFFFESRYGWIKTVRTPLTF